MKRIHLFYSCALSLVILVPGVAQTPAAQEASKQEASKAEQQKARRVLESKALGLLDEVIKGAQAFKLPENRARVQFTAATLLWKRDEKRARALFKEATLALSEIISEIEVNNPQFYSLIQAPSQLRSEMLQFIAPLDPELAIEFLRATRQPQYPQMDPYNKAPDVEAQYELNLAGWMAATDPKRALQIAEASLEKGITSANALINVVNGLQAKDSEAAARLMSGVMKALRSEDLASNQEAANLALNLLRMGFSRNAPASGDGAARAAHLFGDEQALSEMMNAIIDRVLSLEPEAAPITVERRNASHLVSLLHLLMPEIEKRAPSRAQALRNKVAEFNKRNPQEAMWEDFNAMAAANGSIDEFLSAAEKAPQEMRYAFYHQAVSKAVNQGDIDLARKIIDDKMSNPIQRNQMLAHLERQLLWNAAKQGKLNEARQSLFKLPPEEQVSLLAQMAEAAKGKGDKDSARKLLSEAYGLVSGRAESYPQFYAQVQIARAYVGLEPSQSFSIIESVILQLNEHVAAAAVLNGFEVSQYFKNGEMIIASGNGLSDVIQQCSQVLGSLARVDFARAKSAAAGFQHYENHLIASLLIAQAALNEQNATEGFLRNGIAPEYISLSGLNESERQIDFSSINGFRTAQRSTERGLKGQWRFALAVSER